MTTPTAHQQPMALIGEVLCKRNQTLMDGTAKRESTYNGLQFQAHTLNQSLNH
jgi:hypothetical protein